MCQTVSPMPNPSNAPKRDGALTPCVTGIINDLQISDMSGAARADARPFVLLVLVTRIETQVRRLGDRIKARRIDSTQCFGMLRRSVTRLIPLDVLLGST